MMEDGRWMRDDGGGKKEEVRSKREEGGRDLGAMVQVFGGICK